MWLWRVPNWPSGRSRWRLLARVAGGHRDDGVLERGAVVVVRVRRELAGEVGDAERGAEVERARAEEDRAAPFMPSRADGMARAMDDCAYCGSSSPWTKASTVVARAA